MDLLLIYSSIPNHNAFLSVVIYYLVHGSINNIKITLTLKYMKVDNRRNIFLNCFIGSNVIYTLINSTIFDICNCLNNLIPEFFGQLKYF